MKKLALSSFVIALILFIGSVLIHLSHVKSYIFYITAVSGLIFLAIGTIIYLK